MGKKLSEMTKEELYELFPIILKEHNPAYKSWYIEEKEEIIKALGQDNISRINHIGSSAVEGLIAKPTVDILLEIDNDCNVDEIKSRLIGSGWILMSYKDSPVFRMSFNKGYTPEGFAEKVFHIHVHYPGDWGELYFRDYLLSHSDVAKEYASLKQELFKKYEHDRDGYTEAKTKFINKWTNIARTEFAGRYSPDTCRD